jgi:endonuclease-3
MTVDHIIESLDREYGRPRWQTRGDPLSQLIATILSQNTSDANSGRAFQNLTREFGSWERVADAEVTEIAAAIEGGGLSRVKAPRIKAILDTVRRERGALDLGFLSDMPLTQAKAWLESLPGVGPKTAACVLLFSLGRPVLPVDTHVYRVSKRLGLIENGVTPAQAHGLLEALVPDKAIYRFHVNMVAHGRRVCRSQRPRCSECVLIEVCRYGQGKIR